MLTRSSRLASKIAGRRTTNAVAVIPTQASRSYSSGGRQSNTGSSSSSASFLPYALAAGGAAATLVAVGLSTQDVQAATEQVDYNAVRAAIAAILDKEGYDDGSIGPVLVRLAWHASGTYDKNTKTGGSDGGCIRFKPEADAGANAGLTLARSFLEPIKKQFPGITYADLYTLAGAVAIEEMGGPKIAWRAGRVDDVDGKRAQQADKRLPDATQGAQHTRDVFYRMGFNDREIVALIGAHSLGRCHTDRSGFKGPWTFAPTTFSNEYFRLLLEEKWTPKKWDGPHQYQDRSGELMMTPNDLSFVVDPQFKKIVEEYSKDEATFRKDFASAFAKLLELGVNFQPQQGKSWWKFW